MKFCSIPILKDLTELALITIIKRQYDHNKVSNRTIKYENI